MCRPRSMNALLKSIDRPGVGNAFSIGKSLVACDLSYAMSRFWNGMPLHCEGSAFKAHPGTVRVLLRKLACAKFL